MGANHAFWTGNHVRVLSLLLALLGFSIEAYAVNSGNIGRAQIGRTGNSASVGPVTNSGGSTIPVSPTIGGWTQAGNYGVPPSATPGGTMNLTLKGDVVFSGTKYPFQAGYVTPWKDFVGEAGKAVATAGCSLVTSGIMTVGCMVAVPYVWDWMTKAGARANPASGQIERFNDSSTYGPMSCQGGPYTGMATAIFESCRGALQAYYRSPAGGSLGGCVVTLGPWQTGSPGGTSVQATMSSTNCAGNGNNLTFAAARQGAATGNYLPSSMDDIAPYMQNFNPDSRVVGEIIGKGGEIPLGTPTVTGPASIQGPETTKNNADGTKEVSRTTYNFNTAGNTITNTSNSTVYNTYNSGGALTGTRSESTVPTAATAPTAAEDPPTQCDKFPQSLGCAELDTPTGIIPKETKTITFSEETVFGSGACPADVSMGFGSLNGLTAKVVDWQTFCGMALPLRALVIGLASIMALFIIMPGGKVE